MWGVYANHGALGGNENETETFITDELTTICRR